MPELPEVITIRNDLRASVLGKKVVNIKKVDTYKLKPSPKHFGDLVLGSTFDEISNIAKLLLLKMSSGHYIATHLNMSGLLLYNTEDLHTKITLEMDTGDKLNYSETRMFGYFEVWSPEEVERYRRKQGKTPLDNNITSDEFVEKIKMRKSPIKTVLLDQGIISGIGNIYANDALFLSGINPKTKANDISKEGLEAIFKNVVLILTEGILHRGSTIDRYRDLFGKPGIHQNFFRIYGKKDGKCLNCGNHVTYEKMQGRPTFYCENCQPLNNQIKLI
ncbi:bifunctional DNA-formamidopyrimidine glycosylase/DNA-(apurinic or apyrimidinic site) lyase [candidate division WWE3 bacterium]|nr:bifunctional DNA-formamidopyrimidine glycosylase/DNA-(apurinic or apyrimidinic site) lyase [candidate division WWE3 bacterium]